jgi:hypothetical protein
MIIVTGLAALALFSILAILLAPADHERADRHQYDPLNDLPIWALLGRR